MRSLDMDGPFQLTKQEIARRIQEARPGNFALGRKTKDNRFLVRYVGRDDVDVRRGLLGALNASATDQPGLVGRLMGSEPGDDCFKVSLAQSAEAAFEKHCRHFHHFNKNGNLRNKRHPRSPGTSNMACPVCGDAF